MVVILVHWLIHPDKEEAFKNRWREMSVAKDTGLYREILTELDIEPVNPNFHTYSIGDPFYTTYINIAIWESLEQFDAAIGKYIPETKINIKDDGRQTYSIELEAFEFKLRERVVLKVVADRGGDLPEAEMRE